MQIYDDKKKRIGTLTGFRGREITKTLSSGDRELSFEYPANGVMAGLLKEEYYIRTKEDEYVIKEIEAGGKYNKYTAALNVEELEGMTFPYGFESREQTVRACLEFAFEGTGWTIGTCDVTKRRTIDIENETTAWEVMQSCLGTYRCECEIDTLQKRIDIHTQIGNDRGCYFVEGLNLRKLTATSDTYEFYTRLIPIGKDGITIEWLHGKEYLENYQYSSKVKTYTWRDERYTNTTSLLEDAEAKLDELSKPYKVYSADVADLARANQEYRDILDFDIGDTVTMVSKHPRMREKQRIVKIVKYPETPEKNTVELSNTTKTFAEVQKAETELAKTEAISIANRTTKRVLQDYSTTVEVETKITASKEAIELSVSKNYQTKEGMKEYPTNEEMKSAIKISADEISLEVSKKVNGNEIISKINQSAEKVSIKAEKIDLHGTVTANENFKILPDGSMEAKNGKFVGAITGSMIQTKETGDRIVIDTSSTVRGYRNNELYNILDMLSSGNDGQMTLDARNQITIRAPKLAVINESMGTEGGNANVTKTGSMNVVTYVEKDMEGCEEMWVNDVYCTLPVFLYVRYTSLTTMLGMVLTGEKTSTERV